MQITRRMRMQRLELASQLAPMGDTVEKSTHIPPRITSDFGRKSGEEKG